RRLGMALILIGVLVFLFRSSIGEFFAVTAGLFQFAIILVAFMVGFLGCVSFLLGSGVDSQARLEELRSEQEKLGNSLAR
ncbi:MAG: hypothetical protein AAF483_27410, partial [Planctomycetota bacterium]